MAVIRSYFVARYQDGGLSTLGARNLHSKLCPKFDFQFKKAKLGNMSDSELDELVTKRYLGEFTETILLPAMSLMMDEKLKPLRDDVQALSAKVTTHLELSDKRYLELKNKYSCWANGSNKSLTKPE